MATGWASVAATCILVPDILLTVGVRDSARAPMGRPQCPDSTGDCSSRPQFYGEEDAVLHVPSNPWKSAARPAVAASDDPRACERLLLQRVGLQASITALMLCATRLDRRGYAVVGLAMLPLFVFDVIQYRKGYTRLIGAIVDGTWTAVCAALCVVGVAGGATG